MESVGADVWPLLLVDMRKCFDSVQWFAVFEIAKLLGLPAAAEQAILGYYASLQRAFRIGGALGPFRTLRNGILQGCPLSVILINVLTVTLHSRLAALHIGQKGPLGIVTSVGSVDDITVVARSQSQKRRAAAVVL